MIPSVFVKQPWDQRTISVDFSDSLTPGDSLSSIDGITAWEGTTDRTSSIVFTSGTISGNKVRVVLHAGSDGVTYNIRFRLITAAGDQIEDDLDLVVREATS